MGCAGTVADMMRRILLSLLIVPLVAPAAWAMGQERLQEGIASVNPFDDAVTVSRVIDGDTIVLGSGERVRIIGIDAPEIAKRDGTPAECFGNASRDRLRELLPAGTAVELEPGVEETDTYGRTLAHVRVNGKLVSVLQARGGYAVPLAIEPNTVYAPRIVQASARARAGERGLWGACS